MSDPLFTCNVASPQASGLIGWYAGGDPTDPTRLFDSSPLGIHTATLSGFSYIDGQYGRDHVMLLANGYAIPQPTPIDRPPCTITGWTLITFDRGGGNVQLSIALPFGAGWNQHYHSMNDGTGASFGTAINITFSGTGGGPWSLFTWHHWALRLNATNSREYFNDGVRCPPIDTVDQPTPWYINLGAYNQAPPHGLYGFLDDVRVYNRALTDAEIAIIADPVQRMQLYKFGGLSVGFFAH